jgi:hypothetical protein
LAGVFPGKEAVFDTVDVSQGIEAALRAAWHVLEAARLQPTVFDGVIGRLATQEPIDIGQGDDAGMGEEFGHEVCVGFGFEDSRSCDVRFTHTNRCQIYGMHIGIVIPYGHQGPPHMVPRLDSDTGITQPYGM